jgi:hypothetical protein
MRHLLRRRGEFGENAIQFGQIGRNLGELLGHRGEIGREPGNDGVLRCGHAVIVAMADGPRMSRTTRIRGSDYSSRPCSMA